MTQGNHLDPKMVLITFGSALGGEIVEALEELELRSYTQWVRVHGVGTSSPPHLDTHVWPGTNHVLAVIMDSERVAAVLQVLRTIKGSATQEGLRAFVLPVEDYV